MATGKWKRVGAVGGLLMVLLVALSASAAACQSQDGDAAPSAVVESKSWLRWDKALPEVDPLRWQVGDWAFRLGGRLHLDGVDLDSQDIAFEDAVDIRRGWIMYELRYGKRWQALVNYDYFGVFEGWRTTWLRHDDGRLRRADRATPERGRAPGIGLERSAPSRGPRWLRPHLLAGPARRPRRSERLALLAN
ncbi:MAG: hypothetical protein AAFZ65_19845 [Planctomycetota bacterium]